MTHNYENDSTDLNPNVSVVSNSLPQQPSLTLIPNNDSTILHCDIVFMYYKYINIINIALDTEQYYINNNLVYNKYDYDLIYHHTVRLMDNNLNPLLTSDTSIPDTVKSKLNQELDYINHKIITIRNKS